MKKNTIQLPRLRSEDSKPYISFSQYKLWREMKSFNLGVQGEIEYFIKYFFNVEFKDKGWGEFGHDVEGYIEKREGSHKFTDSEKYILDKIIPLGIFQKHFWLDLGDFWLYGIIDDISEDLKLIRDYKTASLNSSQQYYGKDYWQLDVYAMWVLQEIGEIPQLEVCVIERKGNCTLQGGRSVLSVGNEVWYIQRETTVERMDFLKNDIIRVAEEISEYYTLFKKIIQ